MPYTSKPCSLRHLSRQIFVVILCVSLCFAILGAISWKYTRQSVEAWTSYSMSHDRTQRLRSQLLAAFGYGGMIHDFKNYVLRGGDARFDLVQRRGGAALTLLEDMRLVHVDAKDLAAIDAISDTVKTYLDKSHLARRLRAMGNTPEQIDKLVKVNDGPALIALNWLERRLLDQHGSPRFEMLSQFRRATGYGGIVHDIKNYILRKESARADRIMTRIAETRGLLDSYRRKADPVLDKPALDELDRLLDTFESVTVRTGEMIAQGADAATIDAALRWDDGPALQALARLEYAEELQARADAASLDRTLALSSWLALGLAMAIALILPLVAWAILDLLKRRAVEPVQQVAEAMTRLVKGEPVPDLSAFANDSEIGRLAAASQTFRAAHMLQEKLARDKDKKDFDQRMTTSLHW